MKKLLLLLALTVGIFSTTYAGNESYTSEVINLVDVEDQNLNEELIGFLKDGTIKSLTISYAGDFSCTLTGEISYNGASIKVSITAETCEEAGAGLAQATKGFLAEVAK